MSVMAKITSRKLFLFGKYSLALLLPKKWLRELEINAGQGVQLEFDRKRQRIVVRLNGSKITAPKPSKDKPKTTKDADWEEIPQL